MFAGSDWWLSVFFVCAALLLAYQVVCGWKRGLIRQFFKMVATAAAYFVAVYTGRLAVPLLRPLGYPDALTAIAGGTALGILAYFAISAASAIAFKKTSQQSSGPVRLLYGLSGATLGAIFGLFLIWVCLIATRLLGTIADAEARPAHPAQHGSARTPERVLKYPAVVSGLSEMKHSLEKEPIGPVIERLDPVPVQAYSTLGKIARLTTTADAADRFLRYPGMKSLAEHPAIVALQRDPQITEAIKKGNYLLLLRNENIVRAANNPEVIRLFKAFELEKALDYALDSGPAKAPEPRRH